MHRWPHQTKRADVVQFRLFTGGGTNYIRQLPSVYPRARAMLCVGQRCWIGLLYSEEIKWRTH